MERSIKKYTFAAITNLLNTNIMSKNYFLKTLVILLSIFTLGSCTIKKKVYDNGYYVSWKKSKHSIETQANKGTKQSPLLENDKSESVINVNEVTTASVDNIAESIELGAKHHAPIIEKKQKVKDKINLRKEIKKGAEIILTTKSKKVQPLSLVGFILSVIGLFFLRPDIGVVAMAIGVVSIILGIIALLKISDNPNGLSGKSFAAAAIIFGILEIVLYFFI